MGRKPGPGEVVLTRFETQLVRRNERQHDSLLSVPLDPQAEAAIKSGQAVGTAVYELGVEQARAEVESHAAELFGEPDRVPVVIDHRIPGPGGSIPIRIYRPSPEVPSLPGVVYFHGGGWVYGSLNTHDGVCHTLAKKGNFTVVAVGYRLAPEHTFPAAFEDAWAATAWVAQHGPEGIDVRRLAVAGDSAGGNLAAATARKARDQGLPLRLQVLVYPVADCDTDTPSYREFEDGYGLNKKAMEAYWNHYVPSESDRVHPDASVLRADDVSGVAPALVLTAEYDVLCHEGEAYAKRLAEAGVDVKLSRYDGLIHGFFRMPAVIDRSNDALEEAASALRAAFAA